VCYFEASLESVALILPESYLLLFSVNDSPAAMFDVKKLHKLSAATETIEQS
jgi:hypothetical protein